MNKQLGFWKEYSLGEDSLLDNFKIIPPKKHPPIAPNIVSYLKEGHHVIAARGMCHCIFTNDFIGFVEIYTDGEFFWTTEFIYYVEHYALKLPQEFRKVMFKNNYKVKSEVEIGKDKLDQYIEDFLENFLN